MLVRDVSSLPQDQGAGPQVAQGVQGREPGDGEDVRSGGRGLHVRAVDRGDCAGDGLEWAHSRVQQQQGGVEKWGMN